MRKIVLNFISMMLLAVITNAQISGIVKDQQGNGLEKSTVSLLNAKDSSVIKLAVTGANGKFSLSVPRSGRFLVNVSHVGFAPQYSKIFELAGSGEVALPEFSLVKTTTEMTGVTVVSQKPIIEVKSDKTIVNVEGTINATGTDALELLRKSPGVMIDKDDNISLAGKNGVQIYIDGKPTPLTGTDLANFLHSLQSAQIESIEIITNPSAKYEAAGNAGIINIRLKKNKSYGTNGSVSGGYTQGVYDKWNGTLNLNHRNKNVNVFGNYNYNNGKTPIQFNSTKEQFDTLFNQENHITFLNNTHGFKAGMDYFINSKSTVGAVVNGNFASNDITTAGPLYFNYIPTGQLVKILRASNTNDQTRNNANSNLNYRYEDKNGKSLSIDADYGYYRIRSNQFQPNYYYASDSVTEIDRAIYSMIQNTNIDLYSLKADYEQNFKGGKLGFGGKIGIVNTDNDFQRYNIYTTGKILDTLKSNRFKYNENINAVYVNYNKQLKKGILYQAGVRLENTHSEGTSTGFSQVNGNYVPYDSTFKRDYTDLFPSASLTFNKNPMKQWTISYSRRIDRPAYQDLNPFEFKLNEYTFMKGNTQLRPQYTNSVGVTNIYKFKLTTQLNYSHVKDIFAQLPDTIDKTKGFLTKKNLATQDVIALSISYPFQYKWYSFFATVNSNYSHYTADFGGGSRKVNQSVFSLVYYMQNSIKFGKGWTGEITGFYVSPSVWQGVIRSGSLGSVDLGLQKIIFKGKGTVRAGMGDVFGTLKWKGTSDFAGVHSVFQGHGELQQFKLNFSYRFGNNQVKAAAQRKTGIEDEKKRTEDSNGQPGMGKQ